MQDFISFTFNHMSLSLALIVIFVFLIIVELVRTKRSAFQATPLAATQMINHENAVVIDIRPNDLYRKGHIIDSYSMTAKEMMDNPKKLEKFRTRPLIIVCPQGVESQKIATLLIKQGYNAYSLTGGIRGWTEAQMPLVKG